MTGAQCQVSLTGLYDVAGQMRGTLTELQAQARLVNQHVD